MGVDGNHETRFQRLVYYSLYTRKNYGQLLDYKFRKVGIISEYIDMGDKH